MTIGRQVRAVIILAAVFLWDLTTASLDVARIVLSPGTVTTPAIIVVPVALQRPWAVALFAYFTSLTPGSTCLHVSDDRKQLFLHVLSSSDTAQTVARFKRLYERWILDLEGSPR
jgi:multisubunit Na+/H+ antiporter MnhE subunit